MSILRDFATVSPSSEDLTARFLRNFTGVGVPKGEHLEGLTVEIRLTPEEAAMGGIVPIGVPVFSPCPSCGGSGRDGFSMCLTCLQQGMVEAEQTVSVRIPPMVRQGTMVEASLDRCGIHNFYLRLHIRITP
jgi:hypothetical protein